MPELEFQIGQRVDWIKKGIVPSDSFGYGPFTVHSVDLVPESFRCGVGHSQWVALTKRVTIECKELDLVFDSHARQWCLPENLSYFGRVHPARLSGYWLEPFEQRHPRTIDNPAPHHDNEAKDVEPLVPIPAQFLNTIIRDHKELLSNFSLRDISMPLMHWGQLGASYKDVARPFKVCRERVRQVIKETMTKLWDISPWDIQAAFPLDEVLKGKSRTLRQTIASHTEYAPGVPTLN